MGSLERPISGNATMPQLRPQVAGVRYNRVMDTNQVAERQLFNLWAKASPRTTPTHDSPREEKMGNLCSAKYRLKREITIRVFEDDGQWFADYPDLDLIGVGEADGDAKNDLRTHIIDVFEELTTTKYRLSDPLEAQRLFLLDIIEERHG